MKKVLVVVDWIDAWSASTWQEEDYYAARPTNCTSVGWLLEHNKLGVKIAARLDLSSGNVGNVSFIPKACVTRLHKLKVHSVVSNTGEK